jgi:PAS domain S-box-containing protein
VRVRLRFAHKILLMPVLAGVSFLLMLLVSQAAGRSDARLLAEVRDRQVPALELGREVELTVEAIIRSLQDAVTASEPDDLAEADALVAMLRERLRAAQAAAGAGFPELAEWESALEAYYPLARNVSERLIAGEHGDSLDGDLAELGSRQAALRACVESRSLRRRRELDAAFVAAEGTRSASLRKMTVILVAALALLIALSAVVVRSTISALHTAVRAAEGLAHGELDAPIPQGPADEVGQVLTAMRTVMSYMREMAAMAERIARGDLQAHAAMDAAEGAFGTAFRGMVEAEARYRHLIESVQAIVWTACPQTFRPTFVSSAVRQVLGYPAEQWTAEPTFWQDRIHAGDRERVLASLGAAARDGRDGQFEYRMIAADGRTVWLQASVATLLREGQARELVVVMLDVTERKRAELALAESEDRYRRLLANIPDVAWTSASDGSTAFISANVERVYGFTSEEIRADGPGLWIGRIHPDDVDSVLRSFHALFESGQSFDVEYRIRKKDGDWMWVHDRALSTYERDGMRYADGIFSDITERKRLEEQFRQSQKMEAVGQLAGGVAHDFNNMLNVIVGYGELGAKKLPKGHSAHKNLDEMLKAAGRAAGLTRQLLAFSRKQVLQPKVLDLNAVVAEMDKMLRRLIGEDIRLVSSPAQGLGHVKADPGQIEQVLLNLAVNARDAMPKGGALVLETADVILDDAYARTRPDARPGPHVMLAVSDTGHGMDAKTVGRIFEPFFTTKPEGKGTGLGLSTVYGIVRQSGGHIGVYSEPGRGTTFKVYLPRIDGEAEAAKTSDASPPPPGTETILLVEDEQALREMTREILESSGYRVLEGSGPEEALALARTHMGPIALALTDVVMPGMSGLDLAKGLRGVQPSTKVLYMSGYTDDAIGHHGLLDEKTHFLQKPFTSERLLRKVRQVLGESGKDLQLVPESAAVA